MVAKVASHSAATCLAGLLLLWATTNGWAQSWQTGAGFRFRSLPAAPEYNPGFTLIDPRTAGILFSNTVAVAKIMENHNLMNGSGVAAGDFDGDGWCDLYFCAIDGTNALYRNLAGMQFQDVTASAGVGCAGLRSTGAVFADVNGDGRLDLLVTTLGSGAHCFINQGNGTFRETTAEAGLAARTGSTSVALADVDGNGTLDLYVANYGAVSLLRAGGSAQMRQENGKWVFVGPNADRLRFVNGKIQEVGEADVLYLNDGQGHFRALPWNSDYFLDADGRPAAPPLDFGLSVQMRDINGDHIPDIYVCNDFVSPDRIWLNDGTGHFHALPPLAMRDQAASSMGVDFADIDRDGYLDFFNTEMRARSHTRQMQNIFSGLSPMAAKRMIDSRVDVPRNTLSHNRGDGTFSDVAYYAGVATSDWSWEPVFMDVDLDGYEDLLVGNGMWFDVQDRDTMAKIRSLGKQTVQESRTNLALYPHFFSPNVAWRNRHDLTFEDRSKEWGFDSTQVSQGIACADLDNDGTLDLIVNCFNASPLIYLNRYHAPRVMVRLRGKAPNSQGIGALVSVRGGPVPVQSQEILCGGRYLSGDDPIRVFAAGSQTNRLSIEVLWRNGARSVVADAHPNSLYEIDEAGAQAGPTDRTVAPKPEPMFRDVSNNLNHSHHDPAFDDFTRQPLLMRQFSQLGPGVAWVDLDGDGRDELILGTGKRGALQAFHYDESGRFELLKTNTSAGPAADDLCGVAAWLTPAGRPALLVAQANYEAEPPSSNAVLACSLSGSELTVAPVEGISGWEASPGPVAVADMDGDGALELFVGGRLVRGEYPRATGSRIFRQHAGRVVADAENNKLLEKIGLVSAAVWSDLDGDGFPELILACEWGPIRVFKNSKGRLREATDETGLASFVGWWNGITTGDFDGDGQMDIVASNWGLNSMYKAASEHPLRLYYGQLTGSGVMDLIEAQYCPEMNADVPCRTLNALGQAFPPLTARFQTHEAFGRATIKDVLAVFPQPPQVVQATTLQSTLFLNRGGKFVAVPLPAEAQLAPAFAVNVADMDGDGHEDVFLSQNFFAVRPEVDRLDAGRGLWLRGDGKGALTAVPGQESGIEVYGEQRGAALGDFNEDGRIDLCVTQNGAATRVYQNVRARPGLRVRLKGPPGNPWGIGAIMRLEFGSELGPAREVHAGSGYWSQDSLVQVLGLPKVPSKLDVIWPGGKRLSVEVPVDAAEVQVGIDGVVRELKKRNR